MNQEKVLIVEDEENERTGLAELVSAWGYRAETASDGLEGLEKISTWSPSIIVTDLKMPRMTGMELLERLADELGRPEEGDKAGKPPSKRNKAEPVAVDGTIIPDG